MDGGIVCVCVCSVSDQIQEIAAAYVSCPTERQKEKGKMKRENVICVSKKWRQHNMNKLSVVPD